jgi:hypothetical protein
MFPRVVSIIFLVVFPLSTRRSTGTHTPANPAPLPSGAGRRGSSIHLPEPLQECRVAQLCVELARARNDAPQHDLEPRRRAPAARRRTPATPPPHPARTRPGPSDLAWATLITYPFVLKERSTVDPCTGCTARSTAHARAGSCWI